jgi:hypothetical protein
VPVQRYAFGWAQHLSWLPVNMRLSFLRLHARSMETLRAPIRSERSAGMRKTKHRGLASVSTDFMLNLIAYNLIRIPKLLTA